MIRFQAVGADPELFFLNKGSPMSAEGLLGGTKKEPLQMEGMPAGFSIQEDNVAAEFNIPACTSSRDFSAAIKAALGYVEKIAKSKHLDLAIVSAMEFDAKQLDTYQAQTLGCEPDFNAWTGQMNLKPVPPPCLRTAAGHVHISWENPNRPDQLLMGRVCDVMLGIPSLFVTKPTERRTLYGQAGAIRFKPYGIEYRTLDNFWIARGDYTNHIFNTVQLIISKINHEKGMLADQLETWKQEIQGCINFHDLDAGLSLMDMFGVPPFPR